MAFDLETAKPVADEKGGFDLSSAKPAEEALGPKDVPDMPAKAPPAAPAEKLPLPLDLLARGGKKIVGDLDATASIASSIPAQLIGRGVGVVNAFLPSNYGTQEGAARAQATGNKVANALTYETRTDAGQAALDKFGKVIEASKIEGAGPMIPEAGVGATKVVSGRQISPKVVAAGKAGVALTPDEAGAGIVARSAAGVAGEAKLAKKISNQNQPWAVETIAKDLELPEGTVLDREATEAVREQRGQAYEVVRRSGRVTADDAFRADLEEAVKDVRTASTDFEHRKESPILKVAESLASKETFDANSAVSEIKNLRKDAKKAFRAGDEELGMGSLDVARALEGVLDRHLEKMATSNEYGGPQISADAMAELRKSRMLIAKSYAADKALRGTEINPQVYANMLKANVPLTGGALEVAEFARDFPRSLQKPSHMTTSVDAGDLIMGLLKQGGSLGKEALVTAGVRPVTRSILASDVYQALQRSQPSAGVPIPSPDLAAGLPLAAAAQPRVDADRLIESLQKSKRKSSSERGRP